MKQVELGLNAKFFDLVRRNWTCQTQRPLSLVVLDQIYAAEDVLYFYVYLPTYYHMKVVVYISIYAIHLDLLQHCNTKKRYSMFLRICSKYHHRLTHTKIIYKLDVQYYHRTSLFPTMSKRKRSELMMVTISDDDSDSDFECSGMLLLKFLRE